MAVGVDDVPLGPQAGVDLEGAAVDGGDRYPVLVGVDAVVLGADVDDAPVDGQVELAVQALVVPVDVEDPGALALAADVHGHLGVEGSVVLVELVGGALLIDAGHMGTGEGVLRPVGQDHVDARRRGVHRGGGGLHIRAAALIDVVDHKGGGHRAGDVHAVQDHRDHGGGVVLGVLPQVHRQLALGQLPGHPVGARLPDGDHQVGVRFVGGVLLLGGALPVVGALALLVVDDVMAEGDRAVLSLRKDLAVQGDLILGQDQVLLLSAGALTAGLGRI